MCIRNVHMTQIGGQDRQEALRVLIVPIPVQQRFGRKAMPQIMQARSVTVVRAAQANLA